MVAANLSSVSSRCGDYQSEPVDPIPTSGNNASETAGRKMEFPISLELDSPIPIYIQISRALKEQILSGSLAAGSKLPSTQELAASLSVARSTVVKAYEDLNNQGYSQAVAGAGTFVSDRAASAKEIARIKVSGERLKDSRLSKYALDLDDIASSSGATSSENEKLNYGAPPADLLPLKSWKQVLMSVTEELDIQSSDWTPEPFGLYRCRAAVADYLCRAKGLKCSPEQVMIFAGIKETFLLATKLLLNSGDTVAVENPSYEDPRNLFALSGQDQQFIDIDEHGLRVDQLRAQERQARFVYVTPLQDPTGTVMPAFRRKELIEWAQENNSIIWEEAWDCDYSYGSPPVPAIQSYDTQGNVIYAYSFWKALYPFVTLGVLVLPPQLIHIFEKYRQIADIQFCMLEQKALSRFIQEGHLDRHLKKTKRIFEERRKVLIDCLLRDLRGSVEIHKQSSGLHLCVRFAQKYSPAQLLKAAEQSKMPLYPTSAYYSQNRRSNEFLIAFAILTEELIEQRIKDFVSAL